MAIVLIKTPEDTLRISSEKTGTKVKAAVSRRGVVFVKLRSLGVLTSYLFIGKVFDVFEKYKVPVYLATSSNVSVSLAVKCSNDTLRLIYRELHKYAEIGMETEMSVVSVIGDLNWESIQVGSQNYRNAERDAGMYDFIWQQYSQSFSAGTGTR